MAILLIEHEQAGVNSWHVAICHWLPTLLPCPSPLVRRTHTRMHAITPRKLKTHQVTMLLYSAHHRMSASSWKQQQQQCYIVDPSIAKGSSAWLAAIPSREALEIIQSITHHHASARPVRRSTQMMDRTGVSGR